jgi:hypothetical protein
MVSSAEKAVKYLFLAKASKNHLFPGPSTLNPHDRDIVSLHSLHIVLQLIKISFLGKDLALFLDTPPPRRFSSPALFLVAHDV